MFKSSLRVSFFLTKLVLNELIYLVYIPTAVSSPSFHPSLSLQPPMPLSVPPFLFRKGEAFYECQQVLVYQDAIQLLEVAVSALWGLRQEHLEFTAS